VGDTDETEAATPELRSKLCNAQDDGDIRPDLSMRLVAECWPDLCDLGVTGSACFLCV